VDFPVSNADTAFALEGSVGCILAEMLNGKPLFPGRDCKPAL